LAAHAAVRAHGGNLALDGREIRVVRGRERAGRARLDAFAAGDTGRLAHRVAEIEHDLGMRAAKRVADDIVDLLLSAGANAARAVRGRSRSILPCPRSADGSTKGRGRVRP